MEWTKESVLEELEKDSNFDNIAHEGKGVYILKYKIAGNTVLLSNSIGGYAEVFLMPPFAKESISEACDFAHFSKQLLKEKIDKQ